MVKGAASAGMGLAWGPTAIAASSAMRVTAAKAGQDQAFG
jgi:hypothetical protein